jgi:AraC-like DNA-binding protein
MDFLRSAEILIPALTDIPVTIYDGQEKVLQQFEEQYCFSADIQKSFTAKALCHFFEKRAEEKIYEICEPLGERITLLKVRELWVILGPYVHTEWNENHAKRLFAKLNLAEKDFLTYQGYRSRFPVVSDGYTYKIAFLLIEHTVGNGFSREIKTIEAVPKESSHVMSLAENYVDSQIVNRRYEWEEQFTKAICQGKTQRALELFRPEKADMTGIRFMSDTMRDQLAGAAIMRTLIRKAAEQAGLTLVIIDAISQDYAVEMQHAASAGELNSITERLIIHFCGMIRQHLCNDYSVYIKKATQYMDANLGKQITAAELAGIAGISPDYFVKKFGQETGMTIKQYLVKRRCEVAADLLIDSKISIQEIAFYVGYEDSSYFTRVFKEKMGISPQKYRSIYMKNIE